MVEKTFRNFNLDKCPIILTIINNINNRINHEEIRWKTLQHNLINHMIITKTWIKMMEFGTTAIINFNNKIKEVNTRNKDFKMQFY